MAIIRREKIDSFTNEEKSWLEDLAYESPVIIWDDRIGGKTGAYYFGYNQKEDFELFLKEKPVK